MDPDSEYSLIPSDKPRPPILCTCCDAVMRIVKTQIRSVFSGGVPVPIPTEGDAVTL